MEVAGKAELNLERSTVANAGDTHRRRVTVTEGPWTSLEYPVRFDEREEETELSQTGLSRRGESPANRHREATVTAPLLDSTY